MGERSRSSERIEDARTVISEMVANSIRHGQPLPDGTILLTWCAQGQELIVSVTDGGGTTMPRAHNASPNALAGRGMSIIETISKRWWSEQTSSAATVHACLSLA
jgi:anti-sigma regulatory factor (Ser/Thr protein kinase)